MIHCFSYSLEMAKEYLNMGFYLGIGGVLTFNNAKKLKEVVAYMPLDQDCAGDGLSVSFPGAEPRKAQFFPESSIRGGRNQQNQRCAGRADH